MGKLSLNKSTKIRNKIAISRQKEIESFYSNMAKKVSKKAIELESKNNISSALKKQYLDDLSKELTREAKAFNKSLQTGIKNDILKTSEAVVKDNQDWMAKAGLGAKGAYMNVPAAVVESVITGQVYSGKWSLSSAIWQDTNKFGKDINTVIAEGIAQNKSTFDIAKDLEKYVNPSASKDWDWSKVYPGVNKKVDYNAQRLARTMVQHAYQQSLESALKPNPFNKGIRWRSAHTSRTCEICKERDGTVYPKGSLPMDHPNGLCTFIPVMEDLDKVADELAQWANGKSNPGLEKWMKEIYK